MCLLFSGIEPRDLEAETHRIADDAALLLRARTVRIHYPQLPLHILFQTPYAIRQLEDLFIQSQPMLRSLADHQLTPDAVQAGLLEYETRTLCHLEFAAYLLAANVHCNGASTLIRNMLADPRVDRPLCHGDSLSIVEYKIGVRYKLRRISLPDHLAQVRLGDLALELYLRFEVGVVGLLVIDKRGAWEIRYNPAHKLGTHGMLFVLCARYQFRPLVNWLYSKHAIDDLWEMRKAMETSGDLTGSDTSRVSKQSRSSNWNHTGHVEVELPELHLYVDQTSASHGAQTANRAVVNDRQVTLRQNTSDMPARMNPTDTGAFTDGKHFADRKEMTHREPSADQNETDLSLSETPPLRSSTVETTTDRAEGGRPMLVSDEESDEEFTPMEASIILTTCSNTLSVTFVELFAKALRSSASFLAEVLGSSTPKVPDASARKRWERANFRLTVLVPSLSNETHFAEIAAKYGPMKHVAGSVLRIAELARLNVQETLAIVLVGNDTAQGFVEPETTFSGLEVFAMVNVDLLLRHYDCSVYVCAELSQHQALEMVPAAAPRRVLMPLGNPLQLRPVRRLRVYHPIDIVGLGGPSAAATHMVLDAAHTKSAIPELVALRAIESQIVGDDGFRYRNRFASGEMTSTSIFATALITREHALPGVVLLTKSLLGMPVSRFDDRGRRLRVSRPHLHLAALPPAADGIRYVDLVGLVVAAGGLALGLYRSFHHEIRVSVADLHQMLLSRFTSGELEYSRQVKPYESVVDLVLDMASRRGLDPAEWIQRVYEPVEELAGPQTNHRPSSIGRGNVHPFWQRLLCCWQRSLPYPNRILNLGATQNSLPYVLTNPPPYIRASRYDAVYVVTENFERFLSRFHSLCAQHGQE